MEALLPQARIPELRQSPDRLPFSKLPSSHQPVVGRLEKSIMPVYLHQSMPSQHSSSKGVDEQDQYTPLSRSTIINNSTIKRQHRYFTDLEHTPPPKQEPPKMERQVSNESRVQLSYYEKEVQNLKAIIDDLRSDTSRKDQIRLLQRENESLRENSQKLRASYVELQRRTKALEADQSAAKRLTASDQELRQLRSRLKESQEQNALLREETSTLRIQQQEMQQATMKQFREGQQLMEELQLLQQKISETGLKKQEQLRKPSSDAQLATENQQLMAENQRLTSQTKQLSAENKQLTAEADRLREDKLHYERSFQRETERVEMELLQMQEVMLQFKSVIERKDQELKNALEQIAELKQLLTQVNIGDIEKGYVEMGHSRRVQTVDRSAVNHDLKQFQATIAKLAQENRQLRNQQVGLKTELSTARTDSQLLNSHVRLLRTEKESLLQQIQSLKQTIDGYLKSEPSLNTSHEIEAHLIPQSFSDGPVSQELDNLREALRGFTSKLDRMCDQVKCSITQLRQDISGLDSLGTP